MDMKKQNLLFISLLLSLGMGLFSCNFGGNGGNVQTFQSVPAVVGLNIDMGGTVMGTPYGYIAAPSLDANPGDCIYLYQFTVDYDNQPSNQYYTATNISETGVDQSPIEMRSDSINVGDYILPLSNVSGLSNVYYQGKFFIGADCNDKNPVFRLVYNSKDTIINGVMDFYLLAKPSSTDGSSSSSTVSSIYAFDLAAVLRQARDTTVTVSSGSSSIDLRYIKANLNYVSSVSAGIPTYSKLPNPFEIYIFP